MTIPSIHPRTLPLADALSLAAKEREKRRLVGVERQRSAPRDETILNPVRCPNDATEWRSPDARSHWSWQTDSRGKTAASLKDRKPLKGRPSPLDDPTFEHRLRVTVARFPDRNDAAAKLGVSRTALQRYCERLGIALVNRRQKDAK